MDVIMRVRALAVEANSFHGPLWDSSIGRDPEGEHDIATTATSAAIRIIRGHRTISFEAASLLAGTQTLDPEAKALAALYQWHKETQELGTETQEMEDQKSQLCQVLVEECN